MRKTTEQAIDRNTVLLYVAAIILLVLAVFAFDTAARDTSEGYITVAENAQGVVSEQESEDDIVIEDEGSQRSLTG